MNAKKTIKKILALGAGVTMVGATVMGAMAYDLATYPAPFVSNGVFSGKIVVGEAAKTEDNIGAVEIAAGLQSKAVSKETVNIPGVSGQVALEGDNYKLETSSDKLELRETISGVVETITADNLNGLKGGSLTTPKGSTNYAQYIRLTDTGVTQDMTVNYLQNKAKDMGDYLVVPKNDDYFLEWELQFDKGFKSEIKDDDSLEDYEDEVLNIMGTDYSIVDASYDGTTIIMELMAGNVPATLREGETKTFTINGVDYEITLVFVSDPSTDGSVNEAKFSVGGEMTKSLAVGDTYTLGDGLTIGVRDILVNSRDGVASFYLGAEKMTWEAEIDGDFEGSTVEIGDEVEETEVLAISGSESGTTLTISSIKYIVQMDAAEGTTAFVPVNHGVKELMEEPELLISDTLDIKYMGLTTPKRTDIEFTPDGDDSYELTFTNLNGKEYTIPFVTTAEDDLRYGSEEDDLIFDADVTVDTDDYVIVTSKIGADAYKAVTSVLQYDSYNAAKKTVKFTDVAGGSYTAIVNEDTGVGSLVIAGTTYQVTVEDPAEDDSDVTVDVNGPNAGTNAIGITAWGNVVLTLGDSNETAATVTFTVDESLFDTSTDVEDFNVTFSDAVGDDTELEDIDFDDESYDGPLNADVGGTDPDDLLYNFFYEKETKGSDVYTGMTDYGIIVTKNEKDDTDLDTLAFSIPEEQVLAQVFVTMGSVSSTASSGSVTADKVNPITVGFAVMDKDAPAVGTANMIVVGGPCVNTVAAELMGNPADCAADFTAGKAKIKSFENNGKVALLVAGYSGQDTLGASYALAKYGDYAAKFKGGEVEVVVADLSNIDIQSVN